MSDFVIGACVLVVVLVAALMFWLAVATVFGIHVVLT